MAEEEQLESTVRCPNGHEQKVKMRPDGTIVLHRIKCPLCGKEMKMLMHRPAE